MFARMVTFVKQGHYLQLEVMHAQSTNGALQEFQQLVRKVSMQKKSDLSPRQSVLIAHLVKHVHQIHKES